MEILTGKKIHYLVGLARLCMLIRLIYVISSDASVFEKSSWNNERERRAWAFNIKFDKNSNLKLRGSSGSREWIGKFPRPKS